FPSGVGTHILELLLKLFYGFVPCGFQLSSCPSGHLLDDTSELLLNLCDFLGMLGLELSQFFLFPLIKVFSLPFKPSLFLFKVRNAASQFLNVVRGVDIGCVQKSYGCIQHMPW